MLQVYKRMFQGMFTATFGEGAAASEINNAQDMSALISQNKQAIVNYLNSLDIRDSRGFATADGQLKGTNEIFRSQDQAAVDKLIKAVGLNQYTLASGVPINEVVAKINEFAGASAAVQNTSRVERAKPEVRGANSEYGTEKKQMQVSPEAALMRKGDEKWMKKVDMGEFNNFMRNQNHAELKIILAALKKNGGLDDGVSAKKTLRGLGGYKGRRNAYAARTVERIVTINEQIAGYSDEQLMAFLSDIDGDSDVQDTTLKGKSAINFKTGENILYSGVISKYGDSTQKLDQLVRNLGYGSLSNFKQELSNNSYAIREEFQERLGRILHVEDTANGNGTKHTIATLTSAPISEQERNLEGMNPKSVAQKALNKAARNPNTELGKVASQLSVGDRTKVINGLGNKIADILTTGGIGNSMDMHSYTNGIIDDLYFFGDLRTGGLAVGASKNIIKTDRFRAAVGVGASTLTGFVPLLFADIEYKLLQHVTDGTTSLQDGTFEQYDVNVGAHITGKGVGFNAGLTRESEKTIEGMEAISIKVRGMLTKIVNHIEANPDSTFDSFLSTLGDTDRAFFEGRLSDNGKKVNATIDSKMKAANKREFDYIKNTLPSVDNDEFIEAYVQQKEDDLLRNGVGSRLTGFRLGISFSSGFKPSFQLFARGQSIKDRGYTKSSASLNQRAAELKTTNEIVDMDRINAKYITEDGHDVLYIPNNFNITANPADGFQIKQNANGVYISGGQVRKLGVLTMNIKGENIYTLYLNDYQSNEKGEAVLGGYEHVDTITRPVKKMTQEIQARDSYGNPLTTRVDTGRITDIIDVPSSDVELHATMPYISENIRRLRTTIDSRIDFEDIKADNTQVTPLKAFQDKSVDYALSGRDIDKNELADLWKELTTGGLKNFMTQLIGVNGMRDLMSVQTDDEKLFIIDSITMAQRNDRSVKGVGYHDSVSEIKDKKGNPIILREYYENSTMKRRMVENLAKTSMVSEETIELKYEELMNTIVWDESTQTKKKLGDMSVFNTEMRDGNIFGLSAASQSLTDNGKTKKDGGEYIGVRDTSIAFYNGVNETIVFLAENTDGNLEQKNGIPVDILKEPRREEIIRNLPLRMLQREVKAINDATGGKLDGTQFTTTDLENAMLGLNRGVLDGAMTSVTARYDAILTFTGNCMNLELDGEVHLMKTVAGSQSGGEIIYRDEPVMETVTQEPTVTLIEGSENFDANFTSRNYQGGISLGGGRNKKDNVETEPDVIPDDVETEPDVIPDDGDTDTEDGGDW